MKPVFVGLKTYRRKGAGGMKNIKKWISDGCTMFPDKWLGRGAGCCCWHDFGYVFGQTFMERVYEDLSLYYCIKAHESRKWAPWVFMGVRVGGWPIWWARRAKNYIMSKFQ